jgi:hypothetical protein
MSGSGRSASGSGSRRSFNLRATGSVHDPETMALLLYETVSSRFQASTCLDEMQEPCDTTTSVRRTLRVSALACSGSSLRRPKSSMGNLSIPRSRSPRPRSLSGLERAGIQPEPAPRGRRLRRAARPGWPEPRRGRFRATLPGEARSGSAGRRDLRVGTTMPLNLRIVSRSAKRRT